MNITLNVDDDLVKRARKVAIERDTSLPALVREFLASLVQRSDMQKEEAIRRLEKSFADSSTRVGPRNWTRDELHER